MQNQNTLTLPKERKNIKKKQTMQPNEACTFFFSFLAKYEDILFIWLTTQDLPARVTVTCGVKTSHLIWVREFEFPAIPCPADEGLAWLVSQQLQKELPQLDGATACKTDGREGACFKTKRFTHCCWCGHCVALIVWPSDSKILLYI